MKTSELTGAALDYAVAKCEGYEISYDADERDFWLDSIVTPVSGLTTFGWLSKEVRFSTDWTQGGVILEREGIDLYCNVVAQPHKTDPSWRVGSWRARICSMSRNGEMFYGPTPLIAAMRCHVASKLGDEVDVPENLK